MRGDGRVFKRGRIWWIAYYGPDGVEVRESSGSDNETTAAKLLRKRVRDVANHRGGIRAFEGPQAQRLTVGDLLDSLQASYELREIKSLKTTLGHMKPVREFFGEYRALAVTTDLVRKYIAERQAENLSNAKVNRETQVLAAAYSLALKEQRIAHKPHIPHLAENNVRSGFFEPDEHDRILRHLRWPMDEMARFAYVSGWRKEEIRAMRWEQIDRAAKEVRLLDSKNGEGRTLPCDDETWEIFERQWSRRQFDTPDGPALSEFVFHKGDGLPVSYDYFSELWENARKAAGLPGKLFHDYRRTAARNMIRAGVPQAVAKGVTGHKTDSMFSRYNITSGDDMREALRKQREHLSGKPSTNVASFPTPKSDER